MARLRKTRRPAETPPSLFEDLEAAERELRRLRDVEAHAALQGKVIRRLRHQLADAAAKCREHETENERLHAYIAELEAEVMSPGVWTTTEVAGD